MSTSASLTSGSSTPSVWLIFPLFDSIQPHLSSPNDFLDVIHVEKVETEHILITSPRLALSRQRSPQPTATSPTHLTLTRGPPRLALLIWLADWLAPVLKVSLGKILSPKLLLVAVHRRDYELLLSLTIRWPLEWQPLPPLY